MNLVKLDKVGEGGSWQVFRCADLNEQFEWPIILKIAKGKSHSFIEHNILSYKQIHAIGLPTLALLQTTIFDGDLALIGEYLNSNGWLFVSPNRVITENERSLRLLETGTTIFENEPIAEQKLYDSKLSGLINFQDFLDRAILHLKIASKAHLELYFDSYFFGVKEGEAQSELQYKVGDFDQIFYKPYVNEEDLFTYNVGELKDTADAFIRNFVVENKQALYLAMNAHTLSTQ